MRRFNMNLGERIHVLNLSYGASLKDDELRTAMREVDNENPNEMYNPAKKSLKKYYGSSSISNQTKPTLEGCTTSPTVAEHLNALVNARKAFTQIETSCKLKKALKHPVRSYCDINMHKAIQFFINYQMNLDGKDQHQ